MSAIGRTWQRVVEMTRENQWLLPLLGAVVGVTLALLYGRSEASPDEVNWTLTVADGRGTLLSWLSILFAAFSIILALATLTIQNVISKYSMRMYRIYQRDLRDRYVLGLFAMTAAYIMTEQVLLRTADPNDPVPATGFLIALILLIATGIAMIWYITTITRWFRVGRVARRVAKRSLAAAEYAGASRIGTEPAAPSDFARPAAAVPIAVRRSGYLVEPDPQILLRAVPPGATAVIARAHGTPVVSGEEIGWLISTDTAASDLAAAADRIGKVIETESERSVSGSVGYGIVVLVDTAIMALSPAVNDPNTAVQVVEEMTYLFAHLSHHDLGSYLIPPRESSGAAVIRSRSFGELLLLGTEQIVLYGKDDPFVVGALERMAVSLASGDLSDSDRAAVDELRSRIAGVARYEGP